MVEFKTSSPVVAAVYRGRVPGLSGGTLDDLREVAIDYLTNAKPDPAKLKERISFLKTLAKEGDEESKVALRGLSDGDKKTYGITDQLLAAAATGKI